VKQRKANAALLSSLFWPRVPKEKLLVLGYFCSWAFAWDDKIDCGSLTNNRDGLVDAYCNTAIAFISSEMQPELGSEPPTPGHLHNSGTFEEIGAAMLSQSVEDRNRFVESVVRFINFVRQSHKQLDDDISSVNDYMDRRVITSSIETLSW
jgi:hypothetical protein